MSRTFHIGDLLTVTTGRFVCPDGVGSIYKILGYMTGDEGVMTHQLPLACDAVKPDVLAQHPWLADVEVPEAVKDEQSLRTFLDIAAREYGEWHELEPAPQSWGKHDPLADFARLYPDTPVIAVEMGDE